MFLQGIYCTMETFLESFEDLAVILNATPQREPLASGGTRHTTL